MTCVAFNAVQEHRSWNLLDLSPSEGKDPIWIFVAPVGTSLWHRATRGNSSEPESLWPFSACRQAALSGCLSVSVSLSEGEQSCALQLLVFGGAKHDRKPQKGGVTVKVSRVLLLLTLK